MPVSPAKPARPLSPHLQIYRPQLTTTLSILHRASGIWLSLGLPLIVVWLVALSAPNPKVYEYFVEHFKYALGVLAAAAVIFAVLVALFAWLECALTGAKASKPVKAALLLFNLAIAFAATVEICRQLVGLSGAVDKTATVIGQLMLFGWTLAFFYHFCAGIRHLLWDAGLFLEIKNVYRTGWIVVAASTLVTVYIWAKLLGLLP